MVDGVCCCCRRAVVDGKVLSIVYCCRRGVLSPILSYTLARQTAGFIHNLKVAGKV